MNAAISLALLLTFTSVNLTPLASSLSSYLQTKDQDYDGGKQALATGDYQKAIASFLRYAGRKSKEFDGHYYLGLSYRGAKQYDEAIAAFERAAEVEPKRALSLYEIGVTYLEMKSYDAALKQLQLLREKDPEIADNFHDLLPQEMIEQYRIPPPPTAQLLAKKSVDEREVLQMRADMRPTILYREKARYTEMARMNHILGTVVLSVVFSKDGEVTNIRVTRGLPDGLTLSALKAAQNISFTPATQDGQPVSVRGNIEFNFTLY